MENNQTYRRNGIDLIQTLLFSKAYMGQTYTNPLVNYCPTTCNEVIEAVIFNPR